MSIQNTGNGKPENEKNIPEDIRFHSILAKNQVNLKNLLLKNKNNKDGKNEYPIKISKKNSLDDVSEYISGLYTIPEKLPQFIKDTRFISRNEEKTTKKMEDNYIICFIDDDTFKMYDDNTDVKNLLDLCDKKNYGPDLMNLLTTSFLQLMGGDRYKDFLLEDTQNNKVYIIETHFIMYNDKAYNNNNS